MSEPLSVTLSITAKDPKQIERIQQILALLAADEVPDVEVIGSDLPPQPTLGQTVFTREMMWRFWLELRGKKAASVIALIANSPKHSLTQTFLMEHLAEQNPQAFGGYLSALGFAVAAAKLPEHPLRKIAYNGDVHYFIHPAIGEVLREFAAGDGYYRSDSE